jgi:hypothetical protein
MASCGLGFGFFQAPNNRSMLSAAPLARRGAAGGMLATARLTGQTAGAILAAISFRIAGHSEIMALATVAGLAGIAAIASAGRDCQCGSALPPRGSASAEARAPGDGSHFQQTLNASSRQSRRVSNGLSEHCIQL